MNVNGPPDKIAQAKSVMSKLDVGNVPYIVGPPILQTYPIKEGNAEGLAKTLNEIHKGNSNIKIGNIGNDRIMVWAAPEDQLLIANQINGTRSPASKTEKIALTLLEATRTVATLKGLFPDSQVKNGFLFIEADPSRNAIIVKGTKDQVDDVKAAIGAIGESPSAQAGSMRIISLDKGSAATVAEALERMLREMRSNPVRLVVPGGDPNLKPATPKPETAPAPKKEINFSGEQYIQLVEPGQPKKAETKAKGSAPINITAFGNKLIVTSEDPEALALVSELIRLLTSTPGPACGDFEVIRLKNANAVDTAKILDEAFNGPETGHRWRLRRRWW